MRIISLHHGSLGFDSWAALTTVEYAAMKSLGFRFACRYLDDLSVAEIAAAHDASIALVPVQASRKPGWKPTSTTGSEDGARARRQAIALGLPVGLNLFCDLETPDPTTTTAADVEAHARAWCAEVVAGGYIDKVYVGSGLPPKLDELALYKLPFKGYWSSFSKVSDVASRGYQMRQLYFYPSGECKVSDVFPEAPASVAAFRIDVDVAFSDYKGGFVNAIAA
jgi:hypothetical protein